MAMKLKKPLYGGVAEEEKVENRFASDNQNTVEDNTAQQKATTGRTNNTGVKTSSVGTTATASSGFVPSADVLQAKSLLQQWQTNRPGNYTPVWQDEADAYLNQYQNRDPFSYDFNSDALHQQYKDNYIQQGALASMNTMGQAAAMTGGYGNSYAQSAGQQAYNMYLNQLNDVIPELYQMASDRYNQEGQNMLNMYDLYMDRENYEYGKYQDDLSNWYQEYSRLQDAYDTQYNREYNEYRDNVSDAQWAKSFNKSSGSGGYNYDYGDDGVNDDDDTWDNGKVSEKYIKDMQKVLGVTVDGKWGDESRKAAGELDADAALTAYLNGQFGKLANNDPYTMSDTAKKFMSTLPYAHAGSSIEAWKNVVDQRLKAAYESGSLTAEDVEALIYKLGLDK